MTAPPPTSDTAPTPAGKASESPRVRRTAMLLVAVVALAWVSTLLPGQAGQGNREDRAGIGLAEGKSETMPSWLGRASAGASPLTDASRAEIERVVKDGQAMARAAGRGKAGADSFDVLAKRLIRCATFEDQRYCLGIGWTEATPETAAAKVVGEATAAAARATPREATGDLDARALLKRRAALSPEALAALERRELTEAARAVGKVWLLRNQVQGKPLPSGFLARHPEIAPPTALARTGTKASDPDKPSVADYPPSGRVLSELHVNDQRQTYWCGPATMQMIAWTRFQPMRTQRYWAKQLGTTSSGTDITAIVRTINEHTNWDKPDRAGPYVVLDVGDFTYGQWMRLIRHHVWDYRAPMVFHPVLLKEFYPYLDDNASGHYQVGRGYRNGGTEGRAGTKVGFFEPWNQQRFDPSEPYIERVQWRSAYKSYRANQEHFLHNMGV